MRQANIYVGNKLAGVLAETEEGYLFRYDEAYLESGSAEAISLTLPTLKASYTSRVMFPFFDGLVPEGWLLNIAEQNWKLNKSDRMGLLLACCKDCIGAVSIVGSLSNNL